MSTKEELIKQAELVRDAKIVGENTAYRVGSLLLDIVNMLGTSENTSIPDMSKYLPRSEFDEMFAWATQGSQRFIDAKATIASRGSIAALYAGEPLDIPTYITSEKLEARLKELNVGVGGLDIEALESYLTVNSYATQEWVKKQGFLTGVTGYATEQWVTSQGYLKSIESVNILDIRDTDNAPNSCEFKKATFWFNNKGVPQEPYWFSGITVNGWASNTSNVWQIASNAHGSHVNENLYFRCGLGNSWESWRKIWDSGNMGSGSGLDADMLDGYHANSLFRKGVGRLTDASQFDTIYDCQTNVIYSLNGVFEEPYGTVLTFNSGLYNFGGQFFLPRSPSTSSHIFYRGKTDINNTWSPWRKIAFLDDNVASATNATKWNDVEMSNTNLRRRYTINLESYPTTNFYPITFGASDLELDCEIHSNNRPDAYAYNQNHIHFLLTSQGWSDTPKRMTILSQGNYKDTEITIGAIGYGSQNGERCVWVRGGNTYRITSNFAPTFHSSDYSFGNEKFSVGTNKTGGSNANVQIPWTNNRGNTGLATSENFGVKTLSPEYPLDVNGDICTRSGRIYLTPSVWIEYDAANDVIRSNRTFVSKGDIGALTT